MGPAAQMTAGPILIFVFQVAEGLFGDFGGSSHTIS